MTVQQEPITPAGRLDRLAEDLIARGYVENHEFYISGRVPHAYPPSELVGMRFHDGQYQAWFRDMGIERPLAESVDFDEVRVLFEAGVERLSRSRRAAPRGTGEPG